MSKDRDNEGDPLRGASTTRIVGSDDMLTVKRHSKFIDIASASSEDIAKLLLEPSVGDLQDELSKDIAAWSARLVDLGWPRSLVYVRVTTEGGKEDFRDFESQEDDLFSRLNLLALVNLGRIVLGAQYILERAVPLSEPWWLARLSVFASLLIEENDANRKLWRALKFGDERRRFEDHQEFLPAVAYARTAHRQRSAGGKSTLRHDNEEIVKAMTRRIAVEGQSIPRAAKWTHENDKLGKNAEANEALYRRAQNRRRS